MSLSPSLLFCCCCCCFCFVCFLFVCFFHYPLTFNCRMNSVFFLERQPWERLDWKTVACCYCIPHKTTHPSCACFCFVFSWEPLHKMANDLCIYRARIGCFYNRAVNNHDKVFFCKLSVISFYILCCMRNHNQVTIALFFPFLLSRQLLLKTQGIPHLVVFIRNRKKIDYSYQVCHLVCYNCFSYAREISNLTQALPLIMKLK